MHPIPKVAKIYWHEVTNLLLKIKVSYILAFGVEKFTADVQKFTGTRFPGSQTFGIGDMHPISNRRMFVDSSPDFDKIFGL